MRPATPRCLAGVRLRGDGVRAIRRNLHAMERIIAGSAVILIIAFAVPLAVLRAGIWRQEHAASLACRPRGLSAAIARRVFGLYAHLPERAVHRPAGPRHAGSQPPLVPGRNGPAI
jgi:hypothetical protein